MVINAIAKNPVMKKLIANIKCGMIFVIGKIPTNATQIEENMAILTPIQLYHVGVNPSKLVTDKKLQSAPIVKQTLKIIANGLVSFPNSETK